MADFLVLGLGNILLGDEGVGVRVAEYLLERYDFPEEVRVMDGGTLGLDLLPYVEDASRLLVVDAVQARQPPGTLVRLTRDEIPLFLDAAMVSPHQEGLHDLLAVAALKGYLPDEVIFWGVQIEDLGVGLELSRPVAAQVETLAHKVLEELAQWEIYPTAKGEATAAAGV
ncbi:MAG: HyaD/HybD family hydrogenase maturation endopeptidase [Anaerolineae bacterium]|jgi:hydrogenase maturation protease